MYLVNSFAAITSRVYELLNHVRQSHSNIFNRISYTIHCLTLIAFSLISIQLSLRLPIHKSASSTTTSFVVEIGNKKFEVTVATTMGPVGMPAYPSHTPITNPVQRCADVL
jgi:hypothetical protein